jgi:lantibiotic modifying enzyme
MGTLPESGCSAMSVTSVISDPLGVGGQHHREAGEQLEVGGFDDLVAEGLRIGHQVLEANAAPPTSTPTWEGPSGYGTDLNPLVFKRLDPHLYNGSLGVAVFLAACAKVSGEARFASTAARATLPLRLKLRELARNPVAANRLPMAVGALIGLGSFLSGLQMCATLLDDESIYEDSLYSLPLLTFERVNSDERVRFQTGVAGTILRLLALSASARATTETKRTSLEIAYACGMRLLQTRVPVEGGFRAWRLSPSRPALSGFSYGAAGIACALGRLAQETGESLFREAAYEAWAFVNSFFDPALESWLDVRKVFQSQHEAPEAGTWKDWWASDSLSTPRPLTTEKLRERSPFRFSDCPTGWCHGSAGITLGLLEAGLFDGEETVARHISAGVELALAESSSDRFLQTSVDDVCCGQLGKAELLQRHFELTDCKTSRVGAVRLARRVLRRAQERGSYDVSSARDTRAFSPSLFQGHAGIGYTLLRLAHPTSLPSLLTTAAKPHERTVSK